MLLCSLTSRMGIVSGLQEKMLCLNRCFETNLCRWSVNVSIVATQWEIFSLGYESTDDSGIVAALDEFNMPSTRL